MKTRILSLIAILIAIVGAGVARAQTPMAYAAYVNAGAGWVAWTSSSGFGSLPYTPQPIALYCQASAGAAWQPCNPSGGGGGTITLTTTGTSGAATLTGTVLNIPVYGSISGLTTGFFSKAGSSTSVVNSLCDEGITTANVLTCTDTSGASFVSVATTGSGGVGGGQTLTEGTATAGAASKDTFWADSTAHWIKFNPNNAGALFFAAIGTAGTSGHCVQFATGGLTLSDAGAACGSGGGTPAYPLTITGGISGGVVYANSTTQLTVSAAGTANVLMKWGGAGAAPGSSSLTDNGTTLIGTEALTVPSVTTNGATSGFMSYGQGSTNSAGTTNITEQAPAAVTSYVITKPGAAATGIMTWTNASGVVTETLTATNGTGNVVLTTSPTLVTPAIGAATGTSLQTTSNILTSAGNLQATTGTVSGVRYLTATNCSSAAAPAVCGSASSGSFVVAAAATTVTVNTTSVTANSQIYLQEDSSLGTKLSVTCNTVPATTPPAVTARTAATSFAIVTTVPTTNPRCFSYTIVN